jgi:hypothetical protein
MPSLFLDLCLLLVVTLFLFLLLLVVTLFLFLLLLLLVVTLFLFLTCLDSLSLSYSLSHVCISLYLCNFSLTKFHFSNRFVAVF